MKDINNPKTDSNLSMLIEHCATVVMGWKLNDEYVDPFYYGDNPRDSKVFVHKYNPLENIEQAMDLLDQFEEWRIVYGYESYLVTLWRETGDCISLIEVDKSDRCKAIVHAVCKASGYQGEL